MAENRSSMALEKLSENPRCENLRSKNLRLQMPMKSSKHPDYAFDPPSVISPMTELAMTFKESCNSSSSTPRRRLSLSDIQNTPTPVRPISTADSVESGICLDFSNDCPDSPTISYMTKAQPRRSSSQEFNLRRRTAIRRCNSMLATASYRCFEPLAFQLSEEESSPVKAPIEFVSEEEAANAEMDAVGLPDDLKIASQSNIVNRSFSAPPSLESVEKYFEDIESHSPAGSDGFDFIEDDENDNDANLPNGLSSLLDGKILNSSTVTAKGSIKPREERPLVFPLAEKENVIDENKPLEEMFKRPTQLLRKSNKRSVSFSVKRTDSQIDFSPVSSKRTKVRSQSLYSVDEQLKPSIVLPSRPSPMRFERSFSARNAENPQDDVFAKLFDSEDKNLIGDKTKPFCLPLIEKGQHQDLKSISPATLSKVLDGEYNGVIDHAIIIDCRYPYEYAGGHIKTAINIYSKEDITEEFLKKLKCVPEKRTIIIFHCEFSSKRGPTLCRFLRNKDRDMNRNRYPKLYYPELYLLEGGYKAFFSEQKEYCEPQSYLKMEDKNYSQQLKHFTKRSKSWSEGSTRRCGLRY